VRDEAHTHTEVVLNAVIVRADGTRVDLGQIEGDYRSRWRRLWWRLIGRPAASRRIKRANRAVRS